MTPAERQCPEQCLGIEGHRGHHQTTDYTDIRRDVLLRAATTIRGLKYGPVSYQDEEMRQHDATLDQAADAIGALR